jgi:hypothetical protein
MTQVREISHMKTIFHNGLFFFEDIIAAITARSIQGS